MSALHFRSNATSPYFTPTMQKVQENRTSDPTVSKVARSIKPYTYSSPFPLNLVQYDRCDLMPDQSVAAFSRCFALCDIINYQTDDLIKAFNQRLTQTSDPEIQGGISLPTKISEKPYICTGASAFALNCLKYDRCDLIQDQLIDDIIKELSTASYRNTIIDCGLALHGIIEHRNDLITDLVVGNLYQTLTNTSDLNIKNQCIIALSFISIHKHNLITDEVVNAFCQTLTQASDPAIQSICFNALTLLTEKHPALITNQAQVVEALNQTRI